jgi:S-adenosylmethionine hydrolase
VILTFTDFGHRGPYLGLLHTVIARVSPQMAVVDLMSDVPVFDVRAGAYLLDAFSAWVGVGDVVIAVVDPGVGSARRPLVLELDGRWYVGPENGVFDRVAIAASTSRCWQIDWRPPELSASFHGRDLFAPVAALLATDPQRTVDERLVACAWRVPERGPVWSAVIYVDHFGNAMTSVPSAHLGNEFIEVVGQRLKRARTFSDVAEGTAFWYPNSLGLVEIAVNRGNAARRLGLSLGDLVKVRPAESASP